MDRLLMAGLAVITIVILLVAAGAAGVLVYMGFFQSATSISSDVKTLGIGCAGSYIYSIELDDSNHNGLAGKQVSVYLNNTILEKLLTDQNGRLSSTKDISQSFCGQKVPIKFVYNGDLFHKSASNTAYVVFKMPTKLQIYSLNQTTPTSPTNISVLLTGTIDSRPLPNQNIILTGDISSEVKTNNFGYGTATVLLNETGIKKVRASFAGSELLLPSDSDIYPIEVVPDSCKDGTYVGDCSKLASYYCNSQKQLIFDCSHCGCASGMVCSNNTCVSQETATANLVAELQNSIVKIQHSFASGSGIVLDHINGDTIILTNRHVVKDALNVQDLHITTSDGTNLTASEIYIAPNDMDLAVVYVQGTYGELAKINYSDTHPQGSSVLALGSPLGIQGSVSSGIVSNFIQDQTDTGYSYTLVQTDAAINPGNSGGGLFDKETGELIGVNALKIAQTDVQGIGFAIDIRELSKLSPYAQWQSFVAIQRCSDQTPYNTCSASKQSYCSNGKLVPECQLCGCPDNFPYCAADGTCFNCQSGSLPYRDGNNNVFCCPQGYTAYSDQNGNGFCCQPGTHGTTAGTCVAN